jgi:hypothetical protein
MIFLINSLSFFFLFGSFRLFIGFSWGCFSSSWFFWFCFFFLLLSKVWLIVLLLLLLYIFSFLLFVCFHLLLIHFHLILFIFLLHHLLIVTRTFLTVFEIWITSHVACTVSTKFTSLALKLRFSWFHTTWHFSDLFFIFLMMNPVCIKSFFL